MVWWFIKITFHHSLIHVICLCSTHFELHPISTTNSISGVLVRVYTLMIFNLTVYITLRTQSCYLIQMCITIKSYAFDEQMFWMIKHSLRVITHGIGSANYYRPYLTRCFSKNKCWWYPIRPSWESKFPIQVAHVLFNEQYKYYNDKVYSQNKSGKTT